MAKQRKVYVCNNCGAESAKWIGKCPSCHQWNTYVEQIIQKTPPSGKATFTDEAQNNKAVLVNEISSKDVDRKNTSVSELDRILGGGLVPGSFILLGGEPGIGKSTLALQVALSFNETVLYCSGEESSRQIKIRADRIGIPDSKCYIINEQNIEKLVNEATRLKPALVVIDSVQTMFTSLVEATAGSITQIRECALLLLRFAKQTSTPVIVIGHITKDGSLAGPKILEHMVDTVLLFEGDNHLLYRTLRSLKNRFGPVPELAVFEMKDDGLSEVLNPSLLFLNSHETQQSGVAIACIMDGMRPIFVEIQALVSPAVYGTPQRNATGFDTRRLNMLLAVVEKKAGVKLLGKDVFINVAGGMKIQDPAVDLAVVMAVVSATIDISLPHNTCYCAEISLTGELKSISRLHTRISESEKIGLKKFCIARNNSQMNESGIQINTFSDISEIIRKNFSG